MIMMTAIMAMPTSTLLAVRTEPTTMPIEIFHLMMNLNSEIQSIDELAS